MTRAASVVRGGAEEFGSSLTAAPPILDVILYAGKKARGVGVFDENDEGVGLGRDATTSTTATTGLDRTE